MTANGRSARGATTEVGRLRRAHAVLAAFIACEAELDRYRKGDVRGLASVRAVFLAHGWDGKGSFMRFLDGLRVKALAEIKGGD